jgi:hypothetical protein
LSQISTDFPNFPFIDGIFVVSTFIVLMF